MITITILQPQRPLWLLLYYYCLHYTSLTYITVTLLTLLLLIPLLFPILLLLVLALTSTSTTLSLLCWSSLLHSTTTTTFSNEYHKNHHYHYSPYVPFLSLLRNEKSGCEVSVVENKGIFLLWHIMQYGNVFTPWTAPPHVGLTFILALWSCDTLCQLHTFHCRAAFHDDEEAFEDMDRSINLYC